MKFLALRVVQISMVGSVVLGIVWISFSSTLILHTILSGSMEPRVPKGSLVLVKREAPNEYHVQDVITFFVPGSSQEVVTHRIIAIQPPKGLEPTRVFTKGDANINGDSWVLSLGNIEGSVVMIIPFVGYILYALHTPLGFTVVSLGTLVGLVVPFVVSRLRAKP